MEKFHSPLGDILTLLADNKRWLILTHEKPDGDTLGCAAAIASLGKRLAKEVLMGGPDPLPANYAFLLQGLDYRVLDEKPSSFFSESCVVVSVDTSNEERSVKWLRDAASSCDLVNIDHHRDNTRYGTINWVDAAASATGEMVTELFSRSGWGISETEANALYVAIVSDNGHFSFGSTSIKSHEYAIRLMQAGASPSHVSEKLNANLTKNVLSLWGRAFERAETFSEGKCALYWLTDEDFAHTETSRADTENLVNVLLRIKGVSLAALCSDVPEGVRVSLRARPPLNARNVASRFGGGGHDLAAGCTIEAPMDKALDFLRREMKEHAATGFPVTE